MRQGQGKIDRAVRAMRLLSRRLGADGRTEPPRDPFLGLIAALLAPTDAETTRVDCANELYRRFGNEPLLPQLERKLLLAFIDSRVLPGRLTAPEPDEDCRFLLAAAADLINGISAAIGSLTAAERQGLLPAARGFFAVPAADSRKLGKEIAGQDLFRQSRAFRYSAGRFLPVELSSVKPLGKFFGFPSVRAHFESHFRDFAAGKTNLPLLINSLPGHGKTSLTVSHVLAQPGIALILADPDALEGDWSEMVAPLAARPDCRFVLFFDDIDPRNTDWYAFRTNVGGAFSLPKNVMPVLASNYEFPANILSRGRKITFPVFDELRCVEMVEDFLATFGLSKINKNLVSVIAADYTEDFGQKKFTELSPRSLIRYLSGYEHDRIKRKTMVERSFAPMITRPDAQLFYEFNIELMRSLYGEEYIKRLLKERLAELEK